jgi:hypothetical protein
LPDCFLIELPACSFIELPACPHRIAGLSLIELLACFSWLLLCLVLIVVRLFAYITVCWADGLLQVQRYKNIAEPPSSRINFFTFFHFSIKKMLQSRKAAAIYILS